MFGPSRRVARRTARRTSRRQMAMYGGDQGGYDDGGYDEPAPAPAAPAAPAQPDYAEELQKLAELKAAGIINDEEFEAKKKQILGL
jgi:hypothetical protein